MANNLKLKEKELTERERDLQLREMLQRLLFSRHPGSDPGDVKETREYLLRHLGDREEVYTSIRNKLQ